MTYLDEMTQTQNQSNSSQSYEQEARDRIAKCGGDGRTAFIQLCRERGLDPMKIISQFMGNKS